MAVLERAVESEREQVRNAAAAMQPGDSFALDRPLTVEEYYDWLDEGRWELIDGVIHQQGFPSDAHEEVRGWLFAALGSFVESREVGVVRGSRSGIRIGPYTVRCPDLCFFSTKSRARMTPRGIHGAPDLVVEVVASAEARRDALTKETQYAVAGARELWIIDLERRTLRQLLLEGEVYQQVRTLGPEVASVAVPGFHLRIDWLTGAAPLPKVLDVANALVADAG